MIERGLTKLEDLEMFIARLDIKRELSRRVPVEASHLLDDDWLVLSETADILKSLKDPSPSGFKAEPRMLLTALSWRLSLLSSFFWSI